VQLAFAVLPHRNLRNTAARPSADRPSADQSLAELPMKAAPPFVSWFLAGLCWSAATGCS